VGKAEFIEDKERLRRLAPLLDAPVKRHVFVCNGKSCAAFGSAEVKAAFAAELEQRNLRQGKESKGRNPRGEIVLTDCGSIGLCTIGVAVMVYPEGTWYAQVRTAEDVKEIVETHLIGGETIERLAVTQIPIPETAETELE
jgi:(2Fe-2S) ferredoxin